MTTKNYGIKISIDGVDVNSATDKQLLLSTKYPFLKAFVQGSVSLSITGPSTTTTYINHNLGYYPAFVHYSIISEFSTEDRYLGRFAADGESGGISLDSNCDTSKVNFAWKDSHSVEDGNYPYTVYFYYYIFYDSLT